VQDQERLKEYRRIRRFLLQEQKKLQSGLDA
jgi:hypothetical protein